MANKDFVKGVVIGVSATIIILIVIHYVEEYKRLKEDNDFMARKLADESNPKIINLDSVPAAKRREVENSIENSENTVLDTYSTALKHILHLKDKIENRDAYQLFYHKNGDAYAREKDIHFLYDLTFVDTAISVDKEVNNGRGPVDFKLSNGNGDKTLVEFKIGSNTQLKKNLTKQTEIYSKANDKAPTITVVVFTTKSQETRVKRILTELQLNDKENIVLIDARRDNKPSGSKAA